VLPSKGAVGVGAGMVIKIGYEVDGSRRDGHKKHKRRKAERRFCGDWFCVLCAFCG
jgi:hypothetical protein